MIHPWKPWRQGARTLREDRDSRIAPLPAILRAGRTLEAGV